MKTTPRPIHSRSLLLFLSLLLISFFALPARATVYYVSSSGGSDGNNGTSTAAPWQTLAKISAQTFVAGDQVLLKKGDTWTNSTLNLVGNGTSSNPILLAAYGTGNNPKIAPSITDSACITINGYAGWRISSMDLSNAMTGVLLRYESAYDKDYISIENCVFHDINNTYNSLPNTYNHISSAINISTAASQSGRVSLTHLNVSDCTITNVNNGLWCGAIWSYCNPATGFQNTGFTTITKYNAFTNVSASNCSQWGFSVLFMENSTFTNCDTNNVGSNGTNPYGIAGIVCAYSRYVVFDGCDITNTYRGNQAYDGVGFDFEGGVNTHDITYKNATVDSTDGCGIFVFNNSGNGGTPNLLIDNVTVRNFGLNPGNSSAGIDFSSMGNSSGAVSNTTLLRSNTEPYWTGYPTVPTGFTFTSVSVGNLSGTVIVDNNSAEFTGTWTTSTYSPNYFGINYAFNNSGTGTDKVRWRPSIATAGNYAVYYRLPDGGPTRATDAPFTIVYNGGSQTYLVNEQSAPGGSWILLDTKSFAAGTAGYVELTDNANSTYVIADAVKFVPISTEIIVDNTSAEFTGTWTASTFQPNYHGTNYVYIASGTGANKMRWRPSITSAGNYSVYYRVPDGGTTRPTNAPFTVFFSGGSQTYLVNEQPIPGGVWVLLGTHSFATGTSGFVELTDNANSTYVVGDAIKMVKQ